nr:TlpA disulfide reductase family protein [Kineosporia mesophila]
MNLSVSTWQGRPVAPGDLAGRVVLLYAFQMLCPMCVNEATPLINRIYGRVQQRDDVRVIGLHTVFENHAQQGPEALAGYLSRAGVRFPVGIDLNDGTDDAPVTMRRLLLMGTPSLVTVDAKGVIRERLFGVPTEEALMSRLDRLTTSP